LRPRKDVRIYNKNSAIKISDYAPIRTKYESANQLSTNYEARCFVETQLKGHVYQKNPYKLKLQAAHIVETMSAGTIDFIHPLIVINHYHNLKKRFFNLIV
jgi:hypothetical protein